jgi:hypothetical protein
MPVARYFLYVGGVLIALLFAINWGVPQDVAAIHSAPGIDKSTVRISSEQKLPERVVYDTSLPTIVPPAANIGVATAAPAPARAPEVSAQSRVRETFAQFVPAESKKVDQPQAPKKRKIARAHPAPPMYYPPFGPPVRVAQQQRFGFFGAPMWNTW